MIRRPTVGRLLSPAQVWERVEDARSMLETIGTEYEEAHGYVFDRRDHPENHRARAEEPTENQGYVTGGGEHSDVTGSLALIHWGGRRSLTRLSARLENGMPGMAGMESMLASLRKVFEDPDDEMAPMESFRVKAKESPDWKEANERRELRATNAEIDRLEHRLRSLKGKVKRLA